MNPQQHIWAQCICTDPDTAQLRDLVASGVDQRDASVLLWGGGKVLHELTVKLAGVQARQMVRAAFMEAFPWLRLPEVGR